MVRPENFSSISEYYVSLSLQKRQAEYRRYWTKLPFEAFAPVRRRLEMEETNPVLRPTGSDSSKNLEDYMNEAFRTYEHREHSEYLEKLLANLNTLLSFAPITPSFRQFILDGFQACYSFGVNPHEKTSFVIDPNEKTLLWTLDNQDRRSPGLFDKEKAKEFDRRGYRQKLETYFWVQGMIYRFFEKQDKTPEEPLAIMQRRHEKFGDSPREKMLKTWRKEFLALFGDEP